ncbi:ECF-type sigma factor [Planctomycetaceae bacterium SH139]
MAEEFTETNQLADDLLQRVSQGDQQARKDLLPLIYQRLRRLAQKQLRKEAPDHTLQPTALVHEVYLQLIGKPNATSSWDDLDHFFGAAARAMRHILVDHARGKKRLKRGGNWQRVPLEDQLDRSERERLQNADYVLALDDALSRFAKVDPIAAEIVELRFFSELTIAQTARVLGLSTRSVDGLWAYARAWLHAEIFAPPQQSASSPN